MHDSFMAHCLPTDFFFFSLSQQESLSYMRGGSKRELRNTILKYCCLILIG